MKITFKKAMATLLTVVMVTGLLPTGAFAADYKDQVVESNAGSENVQSFENDAVQIQKSLVQTAENAFDITLRVATTEETIQQLKAPDAAVVLVMDVSGSMNWNIAGENDGWNTTIKDEDRRINIAKKAANTFVKDFVADNNGAQRKVSLVTFDSDAQTKLSWTEANTPEGLATVQEAISDLNTPEGGTNMEGGLRLANNLLGQPEISKLSNQFVVMLTDGVPTYYVRDKDSGGSITEMEGTRGGGNYASKDDYKDIPGIATSIKAHADGNAKLYTVTFAVDGRVNGKTIQKWLNQDVKVTQNVNASNVTELTEALKAIASNITKQMQAWIITDPMGEFITLDEEKNDEKLNGINYDPASDAVLKYDRDQKVLTWDLKSDITRVKVTGTNPKTYTYTLTYSIKLDTAADKFEEGATYDTNGDTILSYLTATTENGQTIFSDLKDAKFNVPQVKGELPLYTYTVNYHQKGADGQYILNKEDSKTFKAIKKGTAIVPPIDYQEQYKADPKHYVFNQELSDAFPATLQEDGTSIDLYYDRVGATVGISHEYTTYTERIEDGKVITDEIVQSVDGRDDKVYYVGDKVTVEAITEPTGDASGVYTITGDQATTQEITLTENAIDNVIKFTYERTINPLAIADITVNHVYKTASWELRDGKYERIVTTSPSGELKTDTGKAGQNYLVEVDASALEGGGYVVESIDPDVKANDAGNYPVTLNEGSNDYTITYLNERPAPEVATVKVVHNYTTETIAGKTTVNVPMESVDAYVGETYRATAKLEGFDLKTAEDALTITVQPGENVINIDYYKDMRGEPVAITVNHNYTKTELVLVEKEVTKEVTEEVTTEVVTGTDEAGKPIMGPSTEMVTKEVTETEMVPQWVTSDPVTETVTVTKKADGTFYYAGEPYTASEVTIYGEETYLSAEGNQEALTIVALEAENVIDLNYNLKLDDTLEDAQLIVSHRYLTHETMIDENGAVVIKDIVEDMGVQDVVITGKVGESITIDLVEQEGFTRTDTNELKTKLNSTEDTLTLVYERATDSREMTNVTVTPIYVDYEQQIVDGKTATVEVERVTGEAVVTQDKAIGEKFTVATSDYGQEGYSFDSALTTEDNEYADVILGAGNNAITLYYTKTTDVRQEAKIVVDHHYTFTTLTTDANGKVVETVAESNTVLPAQTLYVGETFTAEALPKGDMAFVNADFDLEFVVTGDQTITLNYAGSKDATLPAAITVNHVYTTRNTTIDGVEETVVTVPMSEAGKHYVGASYTARPEVVYGAIKFAQTTEDSGLTIESLEAENEITINYLFEQDLRTRTSVNVNHIYQVLDRNGNTTTIDSNLVVTPEAPVYVGQEFTAQRVLKEGFTFLSETTNPIVLGLAGSADANNTVTITYQKTIDTTPGVPTPPTPPTPSPDPIDPGYDGGYVPDEGETTIPDAIVPLAPEPETDIQGTLVPLAAAPEAEEVVEIQATPVPLAATPEETVEIAENEVPLSNVPYTGDDTSVAGFAFVAVAALFMGLGLANRRKEQN